MRKVIILLALLFSTIVGHAQSHSAQFTLAPELKSDQWGFIVLKKGQKAISQTEISVDTYLTFLESVSNDSSDAYLETLIPSKDCALFPFVNTENGFKNEDPANPNKIAWIDEVRLLNVNNFPPKEKIKGIDNDALNPYNKPITGISYEQAIEFAKWCTAKCNKKIMYYDEHPYRKIIFRLPTPKEFEEIERTGIESCTFKDKVACDKAIGHLYAGKNEKGCALYNCSGKDTCKENLFASKYMGNELYMVYGYNPSWLGLYNMPGNAAEMTSEKGIAKGGSYLQLAKDCSPVSVQKYDKPEKWLGLRLIAEVVDGATMMTLVSSEVKTGSFIPKEEGDYILMKGGNYPDGICIFKNSGTIHELNTEDNKTPEKKSASAVKNFFSSADKINLQEMWTIDDKRNSEENNYLKEYNTIEYKKDGKVYRVYWSSMGIISSDATKIEKLIDSFWKL